MPVKRPHQRSKCRLHVQQHLLPCLRPKLHLAGCLHLAQRPDACLGPAARSPALSAASTLQHRQHASTSRWWKMAATALSFRTANEGMHTLLCFSKSTVTRCCAQTCCWKAARWTGRCTGGQQNRAACKHKALECQGSCCMPACPTAQRLPCPAQQRSSARIMCYAMLHNAVSRSIKAMMLAVPACRHGDGGGMSGSLSPRPCVV